jgi:hypothetical protein
MTKIVLSASRDIPLNKLVLSQANVRRIKAGVSVEELAEGHRQLDWLWSRQGRRGRPHERLCPGGHAADLGPGLEGLGSGGSILAGGEVIAAEVEEVVDLIVGGEKALSLSG